MSSRVKNLHQSLAGSKHSINYCCLFTQLFTHWTPPLCWVLGMQMNQRETPPSQGPAGQRGRPMGPGVRRGHSDNTGSVLGEPHTGESGAVRRLAGCPGVGQEMPPLEAQEFPCWWERPRRGPSRRGSSTGKGAKAGRAEPTSGGKDAHCPPWPLPLIWSLPPGVLL